MYAISRSSLIVLILLGLGFGIYPLVGDSYYIRLLTKIMALGIFAMSLDLLIGFTGLISLGHAAFFGVSAYTVVWFVVKMEILNAFLIFPAALAVAGLCALVIGWLSIRTAGIYFIMITLAFAQMLHAFFKDQHYWGGTDGINFNDKPMLMVGDTVLFDLSNKINLYYLTFSLMVAAFIFLAVLLRSPFGRAIQGVKVNEGRMRAMGYNINHLKLMSFVIAGCLAGAAGFIEATRTSFVNPEYLSWHASGNVMVMVILGGMGSLYGSLLGALALTLLGDNISSLWDHWLLIMGGFVIAVVMFMPDGISGSIESLSRRFRKASPPREETGP
ncbi:MAG: branched-chain amino acid ABC transporter permease [Rhodospirillales bacterium]|jgi:branched-chain amino acid transport system permease protein|nr:branched-chain amino acid ABC transporter permease [Rhodospirillales bacterium]